MRRLNRSGFSGGSDPWEDGVMSSLNRYAPEVRERAVRLVFEHRDEYASEWAAITSIANHYHKWSESDQSRCNVSELISK